MKKKLLFVIPSLEAGGGEKSLVNLLNSIDYTQYEVDLVLLKKSGIFLKLLPNEVTIIALNQEYELFIQPIAKSIRQFFKKGEIALAYSRFCYSIKSNLIKNLGIAEQQAWPFLKKSIQTIDKQYDVAIGFLEKTSIYFAVDCVKATKKIGFIHNDYTKLKLDAAFDNVYFEKLSTIATVSEECGVVLQNSFPRLKERVFVLYNIVSSSLIHKLSNEKSEIIFQKPSLISVGRLHPQKGFDIAIEATTILKKKGVDFKWYIIGEGKERIVLEKEIISNNLDGVFVLLGLKENPYSYIKQATLYVQCSRFEGKSIAIDEAKILAKPIIVTNFTTAKDQIQHQITGMICEMNAESLAQQIENLLKDENLQKELSLHLSQQEYGTETEIEKFYKIL